ncbi:MAG: AmmeMemoRadiSam system radical SAM enzyme [Bacteroidetes bacterium]|nr:AmmeMemoRadiSam system radical SAM enzyme [Bacteroidota bacterium]
MITLYRKTGDKAECLLCPHNCRIDEGRYGICGVRKNNGGRVELQTYGVLSALSLDPVEKKPMYHYFPGHNILSAGSYGCNLRCDFCQNFSISQSGHEADYHFKTVTPDALVNKALSAKNNIGIAFTYNEPLIWFEFIKDAATLAKSKGLHTAIVSNGYVNNEPLREIMEFIDAFNIDLKAFNDSFYWKLTGAGIEPVKNSLKKIAENGKHLEITTLIIPGQNDGTEDMEKEAEWIAGELGNEVPLHLSRYFPMYKRQDPATPDETLIKLYEIAARKLAYVYIGNTRSVSGQNTKCPDCGICVTERSGYLTRQVNIDYKGRCKGCGKLIYSNYSISSS